MRRPRVLVLNHFAASRGEAGGTRHVELFSRLQDWDYLIIASNLNYQTGHRTQPSQGLLTVPVIPYSSNGLGRVLNWISYALSASWRGIRLGPVDVVYGSSPHLLTGMAAWLLSRTRQVPFVLEVRDLWPKVLADMHLLDPHSFAYKRLCDLEHFLYTQATTIVVMAQGTRDELLARGIPDHKIAYIPNGADPQDFAPSAARDDLRAKYDFTRTTAIYTGAHGPANGLELLLDAAPLVAAELDIVLVGGGVSKTRLQALARRNGLDNVRFMDPVPKAEIPDLLAAADIGLHILADVELFRSAVSPNKVYDYMASGLPVLTNTPGLVAQLITTAHCGVAVEPTHIASGLRHLSRQTMSDRRQMGRSGQRWIADNQSRTSMAVRLESVLNGATS